jgi:hypothetical protein
MQDPRQSPGAGGQSQFRNHADISGLCRGDGRITPRRRGARLVRDPDISPLQVLVTTQAPGLAPLDVERSITAPIELALQGLPGMTSYS